ncbi:MAG: ABC transporter permease [bacterium]|nr:ABC transporter permease [bacterium]
MNIAIRDIKHNLGRFILTVIGIGLLLMVVMAMSGIYRGIIEDATLLIDKTGSELWVVQHNTRGPFAEISQIPQNLVYRLRAVPGVKESREFITHTIQREYNGKPLRMAVVGLSWPEDKGQWVKLLRGRSLKNNHYEMIADKSLGLKLNDKVKLGKETYTVVGITSNMVSSAGDGIAFFTVNDAAKIQNDMSGEAIRMERVSRSNRASESEQGTSDPGLVDNASSYSSNIPVLDTPKISAVMLTLNKDANINKVKKIISGWPDVTVYTSKEQKELLVDGTIQKIKEQIGLFTVLLTCISAIIMALILYTLTLDKLHSIALLKLIGASNRVIFGLILKQGLFIGMLGYAIAYLLGLKVYKFFPRRVILTEHDLIQLAVIVFIISIAASLLGIWKAMKVKPNEALN